MISLIETKHVKDREMPGRKSSVAAALVSPDTHSCRDRIGSDRGRDSIRTLSKKRGQKI